MLKLSKSLLCLSTAIALLGTVAATEANKAEAQELSNLSKEQLEKIIHDYLMENPEVMIQSLDTYYKNQERLAKAEEERALRDLIPAVQASEDYPAIGNANANVTMIEFFDYNCGYCKRVLPQVQRIIENDEDIKVLFVELPILGPTSVIAAHAALAADLQGKYMEFHVEMMAARGGISEAKIVDIAEDIGLDSDKLLEDMNSDVVKDQIRNNRQLAQMLNLSGTPAFIIGQEVIRGAIDEDQMKAVIKQERAKNLAKNG